MNHGQSKGKPQKTDLSDTGIINNEQANSINGDGPGQEDSFQKLYSKELDLDEDEVPIILHELNDSAIHFISRDQYERALSLLQKAQTLIDRLQFQKNPYDRLMVYLTMHNMALCFQKLGALEECALCLEASLQTLNSPYLSLKQIPNGEDPSTKLKRLKYECKTHMQVCALLSQLHRHKEALAHAEKSVQISQYMIQDLLHLCEYYQSKVLTAKRNEQMAQVLQTTSDQSNQNEGPEFKDLIYYDDSVSMLERTAYRVYPIIQECASKLISYQYNNPQKANGSSIEGTKQKPKLNMKAVLGYLNQSEWLYLLNIGNIMQITPMTIHDLYTHHSFEIELTRDSILEKISFLAVSYFCISTELRFLVQLAVKQNPAALNQSHISADQQNDPENPIRRKKESEFWHAKALDIAISFLPSESPLVTHILTSYQKHHAPVQQEIIEDQEADHGLTVIRPLAGIDIAKFQPIVRNENLLNISIPPLPLSPNNYKAAAASRDQRKQNNNGTLQQNKSSNTLSSHLPLDDEIRVEGGAIIITEANDQQESKVQDTDCDNPLLTDNGQPFETNNKSMMELMPSQMEKYRKLLHDYQQHQILQLSTEIHPDETNDDDNDSQGSLDEYGIEGFLDDNNNNDGQQQKHEINPGQDNQKQAARKLNIKKDLQNQIRSASVGRMAARQHVPHQQMNTKKQKEQKVEIIEVQDNNLEMLNAEEEQEYDEEIEEDCELGAGRSIDHRHIESRISSKIGYSQLHNLSIDGQRMKRPKTSQGIRANQAKHSKSNVEGTLNINSNVAHYQSTRSNLKSQQAAKYLKQQLNIPSSSSAERISPLNSSNKQQRGHSVGRTQRQQQRTKANFSQSKTPGIKQLHQSQTPQKQRGDTHVPAAQNAITYNTTNPRGFVQSQRENSNPRSHMMNKGCSQSMAVLSQQVNSRQQTAEQRITAEITNQSSQSDLQGGRRQSSKGVKQRISHMPQVKSNFDSTPTITSSGISPNATGTAKRKSGLVQQSQNLQARVGFNSNTIPKTNFTVSSTPIGQLQPFIAGQQKGSIQEQQIASLLRMNASQDQIGIDSLTKQELLELNQGEYNQILSKVPNNETTRKYLQQIHQILANQNADHKQPQTPLIVDQPRSKSRGKIKSSRSKDKNKKNESSMGSEQSKQQRIEEFKQQLQSRAQLLSVDNLSTPLVGVVKRKTANNVGGGSVNLTAPSLALQHLQTKAIKKGQSVGGIYNGNSTALKQISQPQQIIEQLQQSQWSSQPKMYPPAMPIAQNSKPNNEKLNTHQMIQRFLQDRNNCSSSGNSSNQTPQFQGQQITQFNNAQQHQAMAQPAVDNQQYFESYQDSNSNYKLQLSKKILQQQQKLITGMLTTNNSSLPLKKVSKQNNPIANFANEALPKKNLPLTAGQGVGIQRSATPVIEAHDFSHQGAANNSINRGPQKPSVTMMGGGGPKLKVIHQVIPNSMSQDGNHTTPDQVPRSSSHYLKEQYLTAAASSTALSRHQELLQTGSSITDEGSGMKSAKKKIQAKKQIVVPTLNIANLNVPSNSQQSWQ